MATEGWGNERTEITLPPTQTQTYVSPPQDREIKMIFVILLAALVGVAAFWIGYWIAPDDPTELQQVRNCAGLADTGGYQVKITNPTDALVLSTTCTWEATTK